MEHPLGGGGGVVGRLPVLNPTPVKPWLRNFAWMWYYIRSFIKYQDSNQGQVTYNWYCQGCIHYSNRRHTQKVTPGPEKVLTLQQTVRILKRKSSEYYSQITDKYLEKSPNLMKFGWVTKTFKSKIYQRDRFVPWYIFNSQFYKQTNDTAMGGPKSSISAEICMQAHE